MFASHNIDKKKYTIYDCILENYDINKTYDIIIAEGFIPHLDNARDIMDRLKKFAHRDSIIIITCTDEIGLYIEKMKRLVAQYIVKDIIDHNKKVEKLMGIFKKQLDMLSGMSRLASDWIADQLMNPCQLIQPVVTMKEAIKVYEKEFDVIGSSQHIFSDNSWYKDVDYDYKESYKEQYDKKKAVFLFADDYEESVMDLEEVKELSYNIHNINKIADEIEIEKNWNKIKVVVEEIKKFNDIINNDQLKCYNEEIVDILEHIENEKLNLSKYPYFMKCFGKSQQYISFCKI